MGFKVKSLLGRAGFEFSGARDKLVAALEKLAFRYQEFLIRKAHFSPYTIA
jgi:hypothetical protein